MAGGKVRVRPEDTEAAAWHQKLAGRSVDAQTLEAFFAWRAEPKNAAAYRRVEAVWAGSGRLTADPEIGRAVDEALARRRPWGEPERGDHRPALTLAICLGMLAVLSYGGWTWMQARTVFTTGVGEQRVVALPDGTSVHLDTASRLRVRYSGARRLVELDAGRALFEVAENPDLPFVVQAGDAAVTAIGTVFEVRREGRAARVVLVSGVVDVVDRTGEAAAERLAAGEMARVSEAGVVEAAADVAAETSWTEGRIVFRDTPLATAVAEVNRYLERPLELNAPGLARTPVNGVFRIGDRDAFVAAAREAFGLQAREQADGVVILSSP